MIRKTPGLAPSSASAARVGTNCAVPGSGGLRLPDHGAGESGAAGAGALLPCRVGAKKAAELNKKQKVRGEISGSVFFFCLVFSGLVFGIYSFTISWVDVPFKRGSFISGDIFTNPGSTYVIRLYSW